MLQSFKEQASTNDCNFVNVTISTNTTNPKFINKPMESNPCLQWIVTPWRVQKTISNGNLWHIFIQIIAKVH
jgi:hypothetical protein